VPIERNRTELLYPPGPITEAQIFLTRECTVSCGYCKLIDRTMPELGLDEWKRGMENLAALGVRTVKILGGEPTVKPWLPELISYTTGLGIRTALLSNSTFDDATFRRLLDCGLHGYFASVDGVSDLDHFDEETGRKSAAGYGMLRRFSSLGERKVPLLAANAVIHRQNAEEIPELCRRLSDEGFFINLCTLQHTTDERREFSRARRRGGDRNTDPARFRRSDGKILDDLGRALARLKRRGVRIAVPERYLLGMSEYGIDCTWQCSRPVQLRIDADGGVMLCNEYRTALGDLFNITRLDRAAYARWIDEWFEERTRIDCSGCYWSCFLHAEENIRAGRLEFDYAAP
jgi:MoaA/NifB/PqqE/SkfB family radical SAM enzyme